MTKPARLPGSNWIPITVEAYDAESLEGEPFTHMAEIVDLRPGGTVRYYGVTQ